jgi:glycosyltransferase involved in cell wall biosynthesis
MSASSKAEGGGMGKFLLHAPNVHSGGGLSLLQAILCVEPTPFSMVQLDVRGAGELAIPAGVTATFIDATLSGRLRAEYLLHQNCDQGDIVLCFNNMPPLFRLRGKAIVFVQNRLLLERTLPETFPLRIRLRIALERQWLRSRCRNAARFIVQSQSMAVLLRACIGPDHLISIAPFVGKSYPGATSGSCEGKRFDFVYAASGDPHKNHAVLLEAWRILKQSGLRPSLCLTIDPVRYPELASKIEDAVREYELEITNVGWISAPELANIYRHSDTLIYPSLTESFGLPLIEAAQAQLAILAPESDYVRDVVLPAQTFDPRSPLSIARSVRRHLKKPEQQASLYEASDFLSDIRL